MDSFVLFPQIYPTKYAYRFVSLCFVFFVYQLLLDLSV